MRETDHPPRFAHPGTRHSLEGTQPGHVVSFVADRANLARLTLRVVTADSPRSRTGYDLRVSDFVDLKNLR